MLNGFRVDDTLIVGRDQPQRDDFRDLAAEGVRAVLDLRVADEGVQPLPPREEAAAARRHGLEYRNLPLLADRLDARLIGGFRRALARLPKPVFVHCASGKRSGTLALVDAAIRAGLDGAAWRQRVAAAGAGYGSAAMREAAARYVDRHAGGGWLARLLPGTTDRVARNTADAVNRRIRGQAEQDVHHLAHHPDEIDGRLAALDREWDIERTLEANAASLALLGCSSAPLSTGVF